MGLFAVNLNEQGRKINAQIFLNLRDDERKKRGF